MAWDPTFPQANQTISGSPPQFQANWSYIQTTMQIDHFWANAVPGKDGHHNVIQMPSQAVNPTVDSGNGMRNAVYTATTNTQDVPFFRNSGGIYLFPYAQRGSVAIAAGTGVVNLIDFSTPLIPPIFGHFMMYDLVNVTLGINGIFTWDGTNLNVQVTYSGRNATAGNSTSWINLVGSTTFLQLNRDHGTPRTGKWQFFGTPYQT